MGLFDRFRSKSPDIPSASPDPAEQAVLVHIPGSGLPPEVYEQYDLATVEDQLIEAIEAGDLGEFDGNEFGPTEAVLYMYSADAESLFAGVEHILRSYPLTQTAKVVIRQGGPGAPERIVQLPGT